MARTFRFVPGKEQQEPAPAIRDRCIECRVNPLRDHHVDDRKRGAAREMGVHSRVTLTQISREGLERLVERLLVAEPP
eukprot:878133-Rhodomonas_salina.1